MKGPHIVTIPDSRSVGHQSLLQLFLQHRSFMIQQLNLWPTRVPAPVCAPEPRMIHSPTALRRSADCNRCYRGLLCTAEPCRPAIPPTGCTHWMQPDKEWMMNVGSEPLLKGLRINPCVYTLPQNGAKPPALFIRSAAAWCLLPCSR